MDSVLAKLTIQGVRGVVITNGMLVTCKEVPKSVSIPYGVKGLCDGCMSGLKELEEVSLPLSIVQVGKGVFANCVNLRTINIPSSLSSFSDILKLSTDAEVVVHVSVLQERNKFIHGVRYIR